MSYSFFLFSKLFDCFYTTDCAYDELYGVVYSMYEDYVTSEYNDEFKGEYECIVNYLTDNAPNYLTDNAPSIEGYTIEPREFPQH